MRKPIEKLKIRRLFAREQVKAATKSNWQRVVVQTEHLRALTAHDLHATPSHLFLDCAPERAGGGYPPASKSNAVARKQRD
jgi:hypothetical protein